MDDLSLKRALVLFTFCFAAASAEGAVPSLSCNALFDPGAALVVRPNGDTTISIPSAPFQPSDVGVPVSVRYVQKLSYQTTVLGVGNDAAAGATITLKDPVPGNFPSAVTLKVGYYGGSASRVNYLTANVGSGARRSVITDPNSPYRLFSPENMPPAGTAVTIEAVAVSEFTSSVKRLIAPYEVLLQSAPPRGFPIGIPAAGAANTIVVVAVVFGSDDSVALQSLVNAAKGGGVVALPSSATSRRGCLLQQGIVVNGAETIKGAADGSSTLYFDPQSYLFQGSSPKPSSNVWAAFRVLSSNVTIQDLTIDAGPMVAPLQTAMPYGFYANGASTAYVDAAKQAQPTPLYDLGAPDGPNFYPGNAPLANVRLLRCAFRNFNATAATDPRATYVVSHGALFSYVTGSSVEKSTFDHIAGPGIYAQSTDGLQILGNTIKEMSWYSISLNADTHNTLIANNTISGKGPVSQYWGGAINLMGQFNSTNFSRSLPTDENVQIENNVITGRHMYGAVIRLGSTRGAVVTGNTISGVYFTDPHDPNPATNTSTSSSSFALQQIGVYARGDEDNGCTDMSSRSPQGIRIENNTLQAFGLNGIGIYVKTWWIPASPSSAVTANGCNKLGDRPYLRPAARMKGLVISGNRLVSPDTRNLFANPIIIHGQDSGIDDVTVSGNSISGGSGAGILNGGLLIFASRSSAGSITAPRIESNNFSWVGSVGPTAWGLAVYPYTVDWSVQGNQFNGFYYGIYARPGAAPPAALAGADPYQKLTQDNGFTGYAKAPVAH